MRFGIVGLLAAAGLAAGLQSARAQVPGDNDITIRTECWNGSVWLYCLNGQVTASAPDVSSVTTAGTAVTAFAASHVAKGGWLFNPAAAAAPLCVAISGVAGTTTSAATTCIAAGQTYAIPPMAGSVSVNASDTGHLFSGAGYQ